MYLGSRIGALLLMGGIGERFQRSFPKQFSLLGGEPLYLHALKTFLRADVFDEILLVCPAGYEARVKEEIRAFPKVKTAEGGKTRQASSFLGLKAFSKPLPEIALIHDAVRPFVTKEILLANLDAALRWGAADTCIPSADTLVHAPGKKAIASIPRREDFLRGQTPQTFRYDLILEAHETAQREGADSASDDCSLVLRLGHGVEVVEGSEKNLKITTPFDLKIAELIGLAKEKEKEREKEHDCPSEQGRVEVPAGKGAGGERGDDLPERPHGAGGAHHPSLHLL